MHVSLLLQMRKWGPQGFKTLSRIKWPVRSRAGISNIWAENSWTMCRPGCVLWSLDRNKDRGCIKISSRLPTYWYSSLQDLKVLRIWSCRAMQALLTQALTVRRGPFTCVCLFRVEVRKTFRTSHQMSQWNVWSTWEVGLRGCVLPDSAALAVY